MIRTDNPSGEATGRAESGSDLPRLTAAEDAELRQLAWFSKAGQLSEQSHARLLELRARDRRDTIRDPRPDPDTGRLEHAPRFGSDAAASTSTCPNCGSGSLRPTGTSRSCSYCGFSQRCDTDRFDAPGTPAPTGQSETEEPALGTIDGDAFRGLLLSAVMGGRARL